MKKLLLLALFSASMLFAITGHEVAVLAHDRDDGDNSTSDMKMILIDKNSNERIRDVITYGKDRGKDKLQLMFFLAPADVKDTAFLTFDYDDSDKDDDQWIYLPELKKVKRIASSDKSAPFMGSDFSYADMTSRNVDDYTHEIMKEVEVDGVMTWQILVTPKTQKVIDETGYTKSIVFIRQDNYVTIRALNYVQEGNKLKYMKVTGLEEIDGIWTVTEMSMTTKKGKKSLHKTVMKFSNIKYGQDIRESMFSTRTLEKGL